MSYTARAGHLTRAVEAEARDSVVQLATALERANQEGREEAVVVLTRLRALITVLMNNLQPKQKDFDENPTD